MEFFNNVNTLIGIVAGLLGIIVSVITIRQYHSRVSQPPAMTALPSSPSPSQSAPTHQFTLIELERIREMVIRKVRREATWIGVLQGIFAMILWFATLYLISVAGVNLSSSLGNVGGFLFLIAVLAGAAAVGYPIFSPLRKRLPFDGPVRQYTQNRLQTFEELITEIKRLTRI